MFQFFKRKQAPQGPVQFDFDIEIEAPAEAVYALVDWSDDRNAKRQTGNAVESVKGTSDQFNMVLKALPDTLFSIQVEEAIPHSVYAYSVSMAPMAGRLVNSHERFTFEAAGEGKCLVRLIVTATFVDGMKMRVFERELAMMATACGSSLAKLKVHAEYGVEGALAVENEILF